MNRVIRFVVHELREAVAPTLFFLVVFHVVTLTKTLILEGYGVTPGGVAVSTVGALLVAKAVLVANSLRGANRFAGRPLLLGILWKSAIYALLCVVFRLVEELIPLLFRHERFLPAFEHLLAEVSWPHFWAIQIWVALALISYTTVTELDRHFGTGSVKRAFLHGGGPGEAVATRP